MKMTMGVLVLTLYATAAAGQGAAPKAGRAAPAKAADKAAVEQALIATEQKINDAVLKGDVAAFTAMIAGDAWSIDESMGISPVSEFAKMLKPGAAKITDMKLDNFKVLWVDENTAVLTYVWSGKGTFMDQPVKSPIFASTIFTKRGDKWLAVFHQETPKAPAPPAPAKQ